MNVRLADTLLEATHVDFASECRDEVWKTVYARVQRDCGNGPGVDAP